MFPQVRHPTAVWCVHEPALRPCQTPCPGGVRPAGPKVTRRLLVMLCAGGVVVRRVGVGEGPGRIPWMWEAVWWLRACWPPAGLVLMVAGGVVVAACGRGFPGHPRRLFATARFPLFAWVPTPWLARVHLAVAPVGYVATGTVPPLTRVHRGLAGRACLRPSLTGHCRWFRPNGTPRQSDGRWGDLPALLAACTVPNCLRTRPSRQESVTVSTTAYGMTYGRSRQGGDVQPYYDNGQCVLAGAGAR